MNVGRMIFYDAITGAWIVDTGEWSNVPRAKTTDEQIATYSVLSERNRESFDVLELEYGQYAQDFALGRLIGVDIETKTPIFEYPNPENPDEPIVPEKPLSVEIDELKQKNSLLEAQVQANANTAEFHEDLIVEMAMMVYQ